MKIYTNKTTYNVNPKILTILNSKTVNASKTDVVEVYCKNGVFFIENNRIYRINYIDGDKNIIKNYIDDLELTIDKTIVKKDMKTISCMSNHHVKIHKHIYRFRLRDNSPLFCVVEHDIDSDRIYDVYFQLYEKYAAYSNADMDNRFIKEDMSAFIDLIK